MCELWFCARVNEKVWSAGHDVGELPKADTDPLPYNDPLEQLLRAVKAFPAPVIAMVRGSVWGGACDLIMSCDLVFGDETCAFAITPAKLGLPYNVEGLLNFLNRVPLTIAKEMFFTAGLVASQRAERVGIINELVPAGDSRRPVCRSALSSTSTIRGNSSRSPFEEWSRTSKAVMSPARRSSSVPTTLSVR